MTTLYTVTVWFLIGFGGYNTNHQTVIAVYRTEAGCAAAVEAMKKRSLSAFCLRKAGDE